MNISQCQSEVGRSAAVIQMSANINRWTSNLKLDCSFLTAANANGASVAAMIATGALAIRSRATIQIAGSSTVLPFASIVAEEFGAAFPKYCTPVVGSDGSEGGLRDFCNGVGATTIEIARASSARVLAAAQILTASCEVDVIRSSLAIRNTAIEPFMGTTNYNTIDHKIRSGMNVMHRPTRAHWS